MSVWNFTIYKSSRQAFFISWILEERSQDNWAKQTIRRKRRKNHRNWDWSSSSIQRASVSSERSIKRQNELLKNRKNNLRIHRMRFKRKKPHDHEEKWKQNTLANKVYRLKRESALLGLILCFAISNTTIKGQKIAFKQGVTEELKATDMMRWIGLMNNIRACADEIVLNDIVYS